MNISDKPHFFPRLTPICLLALATGQIFIRLLFVLALCIDSKLELSEPGLGPLPFPFWPDHGEFEGNLPSKKNANARGLAQVGWR